MSVTVTYIGSTVNACRYHISHKVKLVPSTLLLVFRNSINEIWLRFRQLNGLHRYYWVFDQTNSAEIILMRHGARKISWDSFRKLMDDCTDFRVF